MTDKRFVDIRVETVRDYDNYIERVKHNTRYKKEKRVVNTSGFINEFGEKCEGVKTEYAIKTFEKARVEFDEIIAEQKKLNKSFRAKRTKSIAEGILYFSKGINEDFEQNRNEFIERLNAMLLDFCETKKTKIISYQIHTDEAGNAHVHFLFKNFDINTGQALNFTRNKENGEYLQDLAFKHFDTFGKGYQRGIKKEKAQKHLSIEEYKQLKEAQEELKTTKEQNTTLKAENEALRASNDEIHTDINIITNQFDNLIKDFEDFLLTDSDKDKLNKLKSMFSRYSSNENKERMLSTIEKTKKTTNAIRKKHNRRGI